MKKIINLSFLFLIIFFTVFSFGNFYTSTTFAEEEIPESEEAITPPEEIIEEPEPVPITETFIIKNGDKVIYENTVPLPAPGTVSIDGHDVDTQSVLAILKSIDDTSDAFSISDLSYNDTYESFLLNCITPLDSDPACYDWQYVVNGSYPFIGMDKNILVGNDIIYLYFGSQNKVILSSNNINTTDVLTVTAKKYDYENNTWLTRTTCTNQITFEDESCVVGLTQPNPNNTWSPTEVQTSLVDVNGIASFSEIPEGSYNIGIQQDYYFPTESLIVSVISSGGGGGGGSPTPEFSIPDAISYLKSVQGTDGSFGDSELYTDWVAIAYGAGNVSGASLNSILEYLRSNNSISSLITDNERRAMALMSLGENPYSFEGINYIKSITDEFDGTQFGEKNLVNDDIFALIPLSSAGYDKDDDIIIKAINFILGKQNIDGSWEGSVDITAAAIAALVPFDSVDGVTDALSMARTYLKNTQASNGGWGNISSTSWAVQAESALGASWTKNSKNGLNYLAEQQKNANNNGAILPSSENLEDIIWTTSYAIPAVLGKPWSEIMESVSKPKEKNNENDDSKSSSDSNKEENEFDTIPAPSVVSPVVEMIPIVPNTSPFPIKKTTVATRSSIEKKVESLIVTDTTKITPDSLTATTANTLPEKKRPADLPIILSTVSGLILLFALFKIFI